MLPFAGRSETRVEEGNQKGILHLGNGAEPESLDPHLTTGVPESQIISALIEGLIREDGKTLEPKPGVAARWDVNEAGTVYTFHFREDAKWSNGDPVTAQDFVFSYRRMLSPGLATEYAYMLHILKNGKAFNEGRITDLELLGVKAVDDRTLVIELEKPAPYFLNMLNHYSFYPVHPATVLAHGAMDERANSWATEGKFVGNGPFTLAEWNINQHIYVKKSDTYWGNEKVLLNGIVFYPVEDAQSEERMFRAGLLHKTSTIPLPRVDFYLKNKSPALYSSPYLTTYYYLINTNRKPFDDVRVRKALALAINRNVITEFILKGGEKPAKWFTPPGTAGFEPSQALEENVAEAKRLLAAAGFPGGKGFPEFQLLYNTSEAHKTIAEVVQQMWKKNLGIQCQLVNQEWQVYMVTRRELNFDVARAGWAGDYADPHNFLDLHLGSSGNNHTGWSDARYDALIEEASGTIDKEKRFALYDEAESILLRDMPVIPVYWYVRNYLLDPSVKGWHPNILDRHDYTEVYLEAKP
jgi:oligopeptide transport system substrate-binding protein